MPAARERKFEPHTCGCGAVFEVGYFDERVGERADLPPVVTEVACPGCGKPKNVCVPAGAEKTLVVEPVESIGEEQEGGGG